MAEPAFSLDIGAKRRLGRLAGAAQGRPVYLYQSNAKMYARITQNGGLGNYGWIQQDPIGKGMYRDTVNGLFGTLVQNTAWEKNKSSLVPVGAIVDLELGKLNQSNPPGQDYRFEFCCTGGSESGNLGPCCGALGLGTMIAQFINLPFPGTAGCLDGVFVTMTWNGKHWCGKKTINSCATFADGKHQMSFCGNVDFVLNVCLQCVITKPPPGSAYYWLLAISCLCNHTPFYADAFDDPCHLHCELPYNVPLGSPCPTVGGACAPVSPLSLSFFINDRQILPDPPCLAGSSSCLPSVLSNGGYVVMVIPG